MPSSRPPLLRMQRIHQLLSVRNPLNCSSLARELEVSRKTIQRDLEYMRDQLQLPIAYDTVERSYFYSGEVGGFPALPVSEGEVFALFLADQALGAFVGTALEAPLRSAIRKIAASLGHVVTFSLDDFPQRVSVIQNGRTQVNPEVFFRIQQAVIEEQELRFLYRKPGDRHNLQRQVQPYHLACVKGAWYLFARDLDRSALRTFALSRVVEVVASGPQFERPAGFSISRHLIHSFGVFSGEGAVPIAIRFLPEVAHLVAERQWHSSQRINHLPDGGIELHLQVCDLQEVASWIMGWGRFAIALGPASLVQLVQQHVQGLMAHYGGPAIAAEITPAEDFSLTQSGTDTNVAQLLEFAVHYDHPNQMRLKFN